MTTVDSGDSATLREAYQRNVALYEKVLSAAAVGREETVSTDAAVPQFWDVLVITAGDEQQCRHYETGGAACERRPTNAVVFLQS